MEKIMNVLSAMLRKLAAPALIAMAMVPAYAPSSSAEDAAGNALIILTSGSLQTQGMAMVLGNAMQGKAINVNVLLCDRAGDLALTATRSAKLEPKKVRPEQLLAKLVKGGAQVNVCALYLPNSDHEKSDLIEGVNVASPSEMADLMTAADTRVFSF